MTSLHQLLKSWMQVRLWRLLMQPHIRVVFEIQWIPYAHRGHQHSRIYKSQEDRKVTMWKPLLLSTFTWNPKLQEG